MTASTETSAARAAAVKKSTLMLAMIFRDFSGLDQEIRINYTN